MKDQPQPSLRARVRRSSPTFVVGLGLLASMAWAAFLGWLLFLTVRKFIWVRKRCVAKKPSQNDQRRRPRHHQPKKKSLKLMRAASFGGASLLPTILCRSRV